MLCFTYFLGQVHIPSLQGIMDKRAALTEAVNGDTLLDISRINAMKFPHRYTKVSSYISCSITVYKVLIR